MIFDIIIIITLLLGFGFFFYFWNRNKPLYVIDENPNSANGDKSTIESIKESIQNLFEKTFSSNNYDLSQELVALNTKIDTIFSLVVDELSPDKSFSMDEKKRQELFEKIYSNIKKDNIKWIKDSETILIEEYSKHFLYSRKPELNAKILFQNQLSPNSAEDKLLILCFKNGIDHDDKGFLLINYDKSKQFSLYSSEKNMLDNINMFIKSDACQINRENENISAILSIPGLIEKEADGVWKIIKPIQLTYY